MRLAAGALLSVAAGCAAAGPQALTDPAQARAQLVEIGSIDPTICIDLRYSTKFNFLGEPIYGEPRAYLRRDAAERLARVQSALALRGLGLKVWDAYRPLAAQRRMWALVPDERYVSNPQKGGRHTRGASVDVTLVDVHGRELPMPTIFDDFTERAAVDAPAPEVARRNRDLLRDAMAEGGFTVLSSEWWHYDADGWSALAPIDVALEALSGDTRYSKPASKRDTTSTREVGAPLETAR
ncbi:MAG: M15 family metallopeptidase [Planctomycetes bacterium]|nr:M15 family metallopeptidase [Planctomycetota bacterium]